MRAFNARLLSANKTHFNLSLTSHSTRLRRLRWTLQHRAITGAATTLQSRLSEHTSSNPAALHYEEKPVYSSIPLESFVPSKPISDRDLATTRPAKLEAPEPLKQEDYNGGIPIGDRAKWLFRLGRSYLAFYKTGFKNIWQNYKELRKIRARIGNHKLEDIVKYGSKSTGNTKSVPLISRNDYQLALRTKHDLGKLVPFSIVFAICGEFTPLLILAIGSAAVPYTCRIPKQEQSDFLRPVKVQPRYTEQVERLLEGDSKSDASTQWKHEFVEAYRLHANPISHPVPVLGNLWHQMYSGPRLRKHCEEVLCDTLLIRREGGFDKLSPREVFQWSLKYGLSALRESMEDRRREGVLIDPDSLELKKNLLPAVEAEAEHIVSLDWTRLKPENHWLAVYRPIRPVLG